MLIHVEYRASVTCLCHKDHCKQCAHIGQYSDIRIFFELTNIDTSLKNLGIGRALQATQRFEKYYM